MRAAYPNAVLLPHPAMSAARAERVCHVNGLRLMQTSRGHLYLSSAAPQVPERSGPDISLPSVGNPADAAGPDFPEAA